MKVSDVMSRDVQTVTPDTSIRDAAKLMDKMDIGPIPVSDGRRLLGMITDRDIAVRAVASGKDPGTTKVKDVMSSGITFCYADDDVDDAARRMEAKQIRRLVVLDRAKNLVGIVSLGDMAQQASNSKLAGETLGEVSGGIRGGGGAGRFFGTLLILGLAGVVLAAAFQSGADGGNGGLFGVSDKPTGSL